ncbi:MAG: thioredoxin reductase, partial [Actinomycetota bacterium]|nr:thioredoxin reductase [Actinomycetota bacterium]
LTSVVENYPGFADGIMGQELMERMRKQAGRFGAELVAEDVASVDLSSRPFQITTNADTFRAHSVIISTGASAKMLNVPGERELLGHGVSTCATCDGFFFRGVELLMVGGGDSAVEEAIFLTKFASKVTIVHRRDTLRASKIMQDRAFENPKIDFIWDSTVDHIYGNGRVAGARLKNLKSGDETDMPTGGVFVAIGHNPNTALFEGQLELSGGYIATANGGTQTSVPGVFAAGDVVDSRYRQAITAAGMGCMAAMDAERYLEGNRL